MKFFFKWTNPLNETTLLGVLSAEGEMMNTDTNVKNKIEIVSIGVVFCQLDIISVIE